MEGAAGGVELGGSTALAVAISKVAANRTNNVPATVLVAMGTVLTVIAAPSGSQAQ